MSIRARCTQSQDALFTLCCREFSSWFESRGNLERVPPRVFQTFESCHLRTDIAWHDFSCSQNRVSAKTRKCTATPAADTRGTSSWRQVEKRTKENAKEKKTLMQRCPLNPLHEQRRIKKKSIVSCSDLIPSYYGSFLPSQEMHKMHTWRSTVVVLHRVSRRLQRKTFVICVSAGYFAGWGTFSGVDLFYRKLMVSSKRGNT